MKKLILILALFVTAACNETPCTSPTSSASLVTGWLAGLGQCNAAGAAALQVDVTNVVSTLGLCSKTSLKRGDIAMLVCPAVFNILGNVSGSALDSRYVGCNFSSLTNSVALLAIPTCESVIPF